MKKMMALLLALAMVLSLTACGGDTEPSTQPTTPTTTPTTEPTTEPTEPPLTVEQVYTSVQDAMLTSEATRMRMELAYSISYDEGEGEDAVTTEISYDMLMDVIVSEDPFGNYTTTSIAFGTEDFNMDITVDVYMVEEDGYVVTYTQAFDSWSRSDTGMTVEEFLTSDQMTEVSTDQIWSGGEMPADMTLDSFTQDLNGTEVYILRGTTTVSGLGDALAEMGVDLTEETDEIALPVVFYVDTQNYTILRMEADMQGLMDIMADSMSESLLGTDAESSGLKMEISNAVYDLGYGPQEIPALPQEALEQDYTEDPTVDPTEDPTVDPTVSLPIAGQATDLGNGTFVLPCGSEAVTITCPEGWSGEVYADDNVWIYAADYSYYADYYYLTGMTEEDFEDQIEQDANDLKDNEIFISMGDGPAYDGYTTKVVLGEGESYCYAWTPKDGGYLFVILADYTEEPDFDTMLPQLLNQLAPYTGEFMVKDSAADLGNGVFSLPCGDLVVTITCPEGWSGEVYDETNIWIYNADDTIYGDYYYLEDWTGDDVLSYWIEPDAERMQADETFVSQGEGPAYEGYETRVVIGTEISYYYAWFSTGDGCFLAYIYDFAGGDHSATILPQLLDVVTSAAAE